MVHSSRLRYHPTIGTTVRFRTPSQFLYPQRHRSRPDRLVANSRSRIRLPRDYLRFRRCPDQKAVQAPPSQIETRTAKVRVSEASLACPSHAKLLSPPPPGSTLLREPLHTLIKSRCHEDSDHREGVLQEPIALLRIAFDHKTRIVPPSGIPILSTV